MIANYLNGFYSTFGFSYKSEVLSKLFNENICALCLCFSENISDEDSFATQISSYVKDYDYTEDTKNGVLNYLVIILPKTQECLRFTISNPFREDLEEHRFSFLRRGVKPAFLCYDKNQVWNSNDHVISKGQILHKLTEEIKLNGIYNIFENGHGILESGPGHHYVLQNNFHSDKFIRTANILTNSTFIDFLAIFLLNYINEQDKLIYIDTSGILSLAYAVVKLKNLFTTNFSPTVISFNSYDGINKLIDDGATKIIISASTSGKLSKALLDKKFTADKINILFYLNESAPNVNVLCNLFDFGKINKSGKYSHFKIEHEGACSLCANSSYPIKIVGEQFLPEELKINPFSFDLQDRPIWLTSFMKSYFNKKGIIICFYKRGIGNVQRDIYLDFKKILEIDFKEQNNKFNKTFAVRLPNNINVIICYSDSGSRYLMNLILSQYPKNKNITVLNDINIKDRKDFLKNKNILVVSSTITNGRRLIETSLKLRDIDCKGISYFVAISRTPNQDTIDTTRKYIGFDNRFGGEINPLVIVKSIFIPDSNKNSTFSESYLSSWANEKKLFTSELPNPCFKNRLTQIDSKQGLVNNLFWGNSKNESLKLRENFAFYLGTGLKTSKTSQAEVFFAISTILHNLRTNPARKIYQSAYRRHVISPETFICYNDGIIQSSILRAANPIELNYSFLGNNLKVGIEMINVLQHIFNNCNNETGEATVEFLIAISTRRLRLIQKELHLVIDVLIRKVKTLTINNKSIILVLCKYIKENI